MCTFDVCTRGRRAVRTQMMSLTGVRGDCRAAADGHSSLHWASRDSYLSRQDASYHAGGRSYQRGCHLDALVLPGLSTHALKIDCMHRHVSKLGVKTRPCSTAEKSASPRPIVACSFGIFRGPLACVKKGFYRMPHLRGPRHNVQCSRMGHQGQKGDSSEHYQAWSPGYSSYSSTAPHCSGQ